MGETKIKGSEAEKRTHGLTRHVLGSPLRDERSWSEKPPSIARHLCLSSGND